MPLSKIQLKSASRNLIINGGFDIWQRGNSHTSTAVNEYSADRFRTEGNALSTTISRQAFTAGQTDVPNFPTYYARVATSAKPSSGQYWALMQRIEAPLNARQGQTYTLSYWVRSTSGTVAASAFTYGFGGSGSVRSNSPALTTTWQKVTSTQANINVSGGGTYLSVYIMHLADTAPSSMSVEIANVKVEEGHVATDFEHHSYGEELALCHRYFFNALGDTSGGNYSVFPVNFGNTVSSGNNYHTVFQVPLPTRMRATPSLTHNIANSNHAGSGATASTTNWNFYYQNQGWSSYAGNGNMNTLTRGSTGGAGCQVGTYYITPAGTHADQLAIGNSLQMHFNAEL